ncbi:conserved hypothetical protein [Methanocella arvoryzae MRE50]|uniref:Uncharacterized protein n=1 Tax=Methanocella arvoryzae (strain DSM 22066 / NBRC 105507 / MRE50) TaxID=351160 RepID=Q0W8K4_METAR|nr:conserved hypothetical protein [Methanocella arvoryzae MRE50]
MKKLSDNREPRLLAKIDNSRSRPDIFEKYGLSILSIRNDLYLIFKDIDSRSFFQLDKLYNETATEEYSPARDLSMFQSLSLSEISSESQAIDFAYLVSLIRRFTGEDELYLTIRGRLRSENFGFTIPPRNHPVEVSGVQIEVDAGFESPDRIYILEAKMGRVADFNIRQLYYPYRDWSLKTSKEIVPILFIYTNGLFYFFEFAFSDDGQYGNLKLIKSKCYTINEGKKLSVDFKMLVESPVGDEPDDVPYPQANDLDKVIDIVTNNKAGLTTKRAIAEFFDFEERQGDYYANAAIYLGLLKRKPNSTEFVTTREGQGISNSENRRNRNRTLLQQMAKRPTFHEIMRHAYDNKIKIEDVSPDFIASVIKKYYDINDNTARRRSSTVLSWLRWISENVEFI